MKRTFEEIAKRLTGLSTPFFGVSWNPPSLERDTAARILTEFENHRAFFAAYEEEFPPFVLESIIEIRRDLTQELKSLDRNTELAKHLLAIRAACRKFVSTVGVIPEMIEWDRDDDGELQYLEGFTPDTSKRLAYFWSALGELRGVVGIHLAALSVKYGLGVEEELSTIFPAVPDEDERDELNPNED